MTAAEVRLTGKPPPGSSLSAGRAAAGREIEPALASNGARLRRPRNACGRGRARSRGTTGRRTRGRTGPRSPGVGIEADPRSPRSGLCPASTGTGLATVGTAAATGAATARARPVFTSRGSEPGAGTTAGGAAGATVGAGATAGGDSSPVAEGPIGGASALGNKSSGSRYPFGSEARRTPRYTKGTGSSSTPLGPTVPTRPPSATAAPRRTTTEPRCRSVTE
jgi:hypothetical protein